MAHIQISNDIVYRDLDGSVVTLSLTTGEYVELDPVGTRIWQLIERDGRRSSIREGLLASFDIDGNTCDQELDTFLSTLAAKGLILISAN
jgi:Coenzyme PQQ synthesis protein D (PqqD)